MTNLKPWHAHSACPPSPAQVQRNDLPPAIECADDAEPEPRGGDGKRWERDVGVRTVIGPAAQAIPVRRSVLEGDGWTYRYQFFLILVGLARRTDSFDPSIRLSFALVPSPLKAPSNATFLTSDHSVPHSAVEGRRWAECPTKAQRGRAADFNKAEAVNPRGDQLVAGSSPADGASDLLQP